MIFGMLKYRIMLADRKIEMLENERKLLDKLEDKIANMLKDKRKLFARNDLFVKDFNVYLLTSIEKQSGAKIAAVIKRIKQEAADVLEFSSMPLLPFADCCIKPIIPTIDVYVDCSDEKLSEKSYKILKALYEIMQQGIKISLHSFRGKNDKFAVALNNLINNYQIQKIKQHEKQYGVVR